MFTFDFLCVLGALHTLFLLTCLHNEMIDCSAYLKLSSGQHF